MLHALGLDPGEEAVYTALLALPTASAPELARRCGLVTADVARTLSAPAERGLVTCVGERRLEAGCAPATGSPRPRWH
jgi:sugar-specific transcriptional regulator TrmB